MDSCLPPKISFHIWSRYQFISFLLFISFFLFFFGYSILHIFLIIIIILDVPGCSVMFHVPGFIDAMFLAGFFYRNVIR